MKRSDIFLKVMMCAVVLASAPVRAQSFHTYRCADRSQFVLAFYPYDPRAFVQIDGRSITLPKRLALSGTRYSSADVTLKITKAGTTTIRHGGQRETTCEPF